MAYTPIDADDPAPPTPAEVAASVSQGISTVATSGHYLLFKGPAFYVGIYRIKKWEAEERAKIFRETENVEEFVYAKEKAQHNVDRCDLVRRLTEYMRKEGIVVFSHIRVDGEDRMGQVFQKDIDVDGIVSGVLGKWDEGRPRERAENFLRRFLDFPRRFDPRTIKKMRPFIFSKTCWVTTARPATPPTPQAASTSS